MAPHHVRHYRYVSPKTTLREQRFVAAYVQHLDATRAAKEAGYRGKNLNRRGFDLMNRQPIFRAIQAKQAEQVAALDLSAMKVKREIGALAFCDPAGCFDADGQPLRLQDMPPHVRAAVKSVQVTALDDRVVACKVEFWSKVDALRLAAQHLALLAPKELTVTHRFPHAHLTDAELKQRLLEASETITLDPA